MSVFEMVSLIVAIGCGTQVVCKFLDVAKAAVSKGSKKQGQEELLKELRALRGEISQVRSQNNDVVLNLDTTVQRLEHRLDHLESRAHLPASSSSEQEQLLIQRR